LPAGNEAFLAAAQARPVANEGAWQARQAVLADKQAFGAGWQAFAAGWQAFAAARPRSFQKLVRTNAPKTG
jgi:hypothetical protein